MVFFVVFLPFLPVLLFDLINIIIFPSFYFLSYEQIGYLVDKIKHFRYIWLFSSSHKHRLNLSSILVIHTFILLGNKLYFLSVWSSLCVFFRLSESGTSLNVEVMERLLWDSLTLIPVLQIKLMTNKKCALIYVHVHRSCRSLCSCLCLCNPPSSIKAS